MRPSWFVILIDQSTSDSFKEVWSLHESLANCEIVHKAFLGSHVPGQLDILESDMCGYWTLLFNRFSYLCEEGILILVELRSHFLEGLTIEDVTDVLLVLDNSVFWRLVVTAQHVINRFFWLL